MQALTKFAKVKYVVICSYMCMQIVVALINTGMEMAIMHGSHQYFHMTDTKYWNGNEATAHHYFEILNTGLGTRLWYMWNGMGHTYP